MTSGLESFFKYIPPRLVKTIVSLPSELFKDVTEIRLRRNQPLSLTVGSRNITLDSNGNPCNIAKSIIVSNQEIDYCLSLISQGSLYSYDDMIAKGYIPLKEGGRAGVCGEGIVRNGVISGFYKINSINLRLHRNIPFFARELAEYYAKNGVCGTLIYSPPAAGKTTFLRSIAYLLCEGKNTPPYRVGIADERSEIHISGVCKGLIDVISDCPKGEAIELLTRTMSPEIIVCDEIGTKEEQAIINAQNTGVFLIASTHGENIENIKKRPFINKIIQSGIFKIAVKLSKGFNSEIEELENDS